MAVEPGAPPRGAWTAGTDNRRAGGPLCGWAWAAGVAAALAVGAAAAVDPATGLFAAIGIVVGTAVALRPPIMLGVLIASMFVEDATVASVNISRIVAPVALLVVALGAARRESPRLWGSRAWSGPLPWVAAYATWALASGLWSVDVSGTWFKLGSLAIALVYMAAFASLVVSTEQIKRGMGLVAALAVATGAAATAAFMLDPSTRGEGLVGDPNAFAALQVAALPAVVLLAGEARTWGDRGIHYGAAVVVLVSILASVSRGGLVAAAVVLVVLIAVPTGAIFASGRERAVVALVLLVGAGAAFAATGDTVGPRLEEALLLTDAPQSEATGSGRLTIWHGAVTAIEREPVLGLGFGAFQSQSVELVRRSPGADLARFDLLPQGHQVHSAFLGSAAELGLVGAAALVGLLVATASTLRRAAARARSSGQGRLRRMANAVLISLTGWVVASAFLSTEVSRPLWAIAGVAIALERIASTRPGEAGN